MLIRQCGVALLCLLFAIPSLAAKPEIPPMPIAQELPVELRLVQQEMQVEVSGSGGNAAAMAVGGLLGAFVGAAINQASVANAEKRVAELRTQLLNYRFNERFETEIRRNFNAGLSPNPQFKVEHSVFVANDSSGKSAPGKGILMIMPGYTMSQDFESLKVTAAVSYVDRTLDKKNRLRQHVRFIRNYAWVYQMPKVSGSAATEDAARWVQLGGDKLAAMIDNGIVQTVALINYDFTEAGRADPGAQGIAAAAQGGTFFPADVYGADQVRVQRSGGRGPNGLTGLVSTEVPVPATPAMTASAAATAVPAPAAAPAPAATPAATPSAAPAPGQ